MKKKPGKKPPQKSYLKKKVRYATAKQGNEEFSFKVRSIRYRDSKNRIVKFTTKKRLKVEIMMSTRVRSLKTGKMTSKLTKMRSYSLPLRKRKRPVSIEETEKRIRKRAFKNKKSLRETIEDGKVKFTYF